MMKNKEIHSRIVKSRTLIKKHLSSNEKKISKNKTKNDIKNQFERILPFLEKEHPELLEMLLNFENHNLDREQLRALQENIVKQESPFKHTMFTKKQDNLIHYYFGFSYEIRMEASLFLSSIKPFEQSRFHKLSQMLDREKLSELSYLRRNISLESRIRRQIAVIIKYLPREINREISRLDSENKD